MKTKIVILAAGQGTRMKSDIPKVMHKVCNLPMLEYVISNAEKLSKDKPIIVIGHKAEEIKMYFGSRGTFVLQEQRLGTGHALMMAIDYIEEDDNVLVICGDTPLIETDSLS
ncbi:MAG: NTP transferase domain-containing protein, partial [Filifactoraceae bacterium]